MAGIEKAVLNFQAQKKPDSKLMLSGS